MQVSLSTPDSSHRCPQKLDVTYSLQPPSSCRASLTLFLLFIDFAAEKQQTSLGYIYIYGQIIATSHDLTPNAGLVREIPLFQGNLGW